MNEEVKWFASSERTVGGRPDTRYGWIEREGLTVIVKWLDESVNPMAPELLRAEAQALRYLKQAEAPAARLLAQKLDRLELEFAGLTLRWLAAPPSGMPGLSFVEQATVLSCLLRRLKAYVEAQALPVDLWAGNIVVPLTHDLSGRVRLHQAGLIDHAHAVIAGMDLSVPVWINAEMPRIAPEVAVLIRQDQASWRADRQDAVRGPHQAPRPMRLQTAMDAGELDVGAAVQFSIGRELQRVARREGLHDEPRMRDVIARLCAPVPDNRYAGVEAAADAIADRVGRRPVVSVAIYPTIGPDLLSSGSSSGTTADGSEPSGRRDSEPISHFAASSQDDDGTILPGAVASDGPDNRTAGRALAPMPRQRKVLRRMGFAGALLALAALIVVAVGPWAMSASQGGGAASPITAADWARLKRTLAGRAAHESLISRMGRGEGTALREWARMRPSVDQFARTGNVEACELQLLGDALAARYGQRFPSPGCQLRPVTRAFGT